MNKGKKLKLIFVYNIKLNKMQEEINRKNYNSYNKIDILNVKF